MKIYKIGGFANQEKQKKDMLEKFLPLLEIGKVYRYNSKTLYSGTYKLESIDADGTLQGTDVDTNRKFPLKAIQWDNFGRNIFALEV